jgi:hypothetical protein
MSTQRYSVTPHAIETLLIWVKSGEIAIPEIQRPFVWEATKVRNLLDSLYQGYLVTKEADLRSNLKMHCLRRNFSTVRFRTTMSFWSNAEGSWRSASRRGWKRCKGGHVLL